MSVTKLELRIDQFAVALARLHEVVARDVAEDLVVDAGIQRFEFTFEIAWKALRAASETKGVQVTSPCDAIKHGFAAGWVSDEAIWLDLMKARNETSHVYNQTIALGIFERVKRDMPAFDNLLAALRTYRAALKAGGS